MSLFSRLADLSDEELVRLISKLDEDSAKKLLFDWDSRARDSQKEPDGDWVTWLILAGRGWGKTRTGAEWIKKRVRNGARRIALVAPTAADVRDIMVEGTSGILSIFPDDERPLYEPSKRRITFSTGAVATTYSGDEPDRLRGANTDTAWIDELGSFRYPEAYEMLKLGLRIGRNPRCIITTTPKPVKVIRDLVVEDDCFVTKGSTFDNRENLSPVFFNSVVKKLQGTRLGRQELYAEILDDVPGALWKREWIDDKRLVGFEHEKLVRIVVGIDPAVTSGEDSDETGILVVGKDIEGRGYVLEDLSCRLSPDGWANVAVKAYHRWRADRIIAEVNQGGDLVERVLRTVDRNIPYKKVHASKGKYTRAEPIAALYEQGKIYHVGMFDRLEDQMCMFLPDSKEFGSPDRVDALVWGFSELMLGSGFVFV
jgi:phage terminase large subunit-like protein